MTPWLRPAQPLDAGRTGAILHGFLDETAWIPNLHTGAETVSFCGKMIDRGWVTVAGYRDRVDGFIARDGSEINALYIAPEARGTGLGQALLWAAQEAAQRLELRTFEANLGAQRFYERHGFRETRRTDGAGNDENLPDIHYLWVKGEA